MYGKIILDPSVMQPEALDEVLDLSEAKSDFEVVVLLSPFQKLLLEERGVKSVSIWGLEWPLSERMALISRLMSYWDALEDKPEALLEIEVDKHRYHLNVPKIYRFYIVNNWKFFVVACVLLENARRWQQSNIFVVTEDRSFYTAVQAISQLYGVAVRKIDVHSMNNNTSRNAALRHIATAATREVENIWRVICLQFKSNGNLFVEKHRQTDPILSGLKQEGFSIIQNLNSAIGRLFVSRCLEKRISALSQNCVDIMKVLFRSNSFGADSIAWQHVLDFFVDMAQPEVRDAVGRVIMTWWYLNRIKPRAAVCINWLSPEQQAIRSWAKANRVPFIALQHGIHSGGVINPTEGRIDADLFLAWGRRSKEEFVKYDTSNGPVIAVTGNPCHGDLGHLGRHKECYRNNASDYILIAPSAFTYFHLDKGYYFWSQIEDLVKSYPNLRWVVRCHRFDPLGHFIAERFRRLKASISYRDTPSIMTLLENCCLVITSVSTVALDAMWMRVPVVIVNNSTVPELFSEYGAGIVITRAEDLPKVFRQLVANGFYDRTLMINQKRFLDDFSCPNAISNVINTIRFWASGESKNTCFSLTDGA